MKIKLSRGEKAYKIFNYIFLTVITIVCLAPIIHVLALSFSDNVAAASGKVGFWPVNFTTAAYDYLIEKKDFFNSVKVSALRVIIGSIINMLLIILTAYPLSKSNKLFRHRNKYMTYFAVTMFISGGLIPTYMVIKSLGLLDSFWSLILPGAVNVWSVIILMNFFRGIPQAMEEAASIDGANHWQILFKIYVPMAVPSLVSLLLFTMIGHWNSWFDGMFYLNDPSNYPMATFLSTQIVNSNQNLATVTPEQLEILSSLSDKTMKSAQIFLSIVPILLVYPFLQKFFIKGMTIGSVKE